MEAVKIRSATPADLDFLVEANAAMARETEDRALDQARVREGVRAALSDPSRGRYFLAEESGRAVGTLMVTTEWSDWRNGFFWWIQSVYVLPRARGQGCFRALYRHVLDQAREAGDVCGLRLYVEKRNRRAQRVYEKEGMAPATYRMYEVDFVLGGEKVR
ncbi:MAG: GNAT family N-acetyltransferase [Planctomycetota bacterium]